jgi:hypothetical protein
MMGSYCDSGWTSVNSTVEPARHPVFHVLPSSADCLDVPGGVAFDDVLQERLGTVPIDARTSEAAPLHATLRPAPAHPFLFSAPELSFGGTAYGSKRPGRPAPPRRLSARQQRALDRLVALGAELRADFSLHVLRSAFRSLARRYHPDRHPDSGPAEKARLSGVFAELNDSYRRLLAVFDDPCVVC